jgi:hypothetical protein
LVGFRDWLETAARQWCPCGLSQRKLSTRSAHDCCYHYIPVDSPDAYFQGASCREDQNFKPEHAYASYDATVKVISADGGIPDDGLKLLLDQAKRDAKAIREVPITKSPTSACYEKCKRKWDCARCQEK